MITKYGVVTVWIEENGTKVAVKNFDGDCGPKETGYEAMEWALDVLSAHLRER